MPRGTYTIEQQEKALLKAALKKPQTAAELVDRAKLNVAPRGAGRALSSLVKGKKLVKHTGTVNGNRAPRYAKA